MDAWLAQRNSGVRIHCVTVRCSAIIDDLGQMPPWVAALVMASVALTLCSPCLTMSSQHMAAQGMLASTALFVGAVVGMSVSRQQEAAAQTRAEVYSTCVPGSCPPDLSTRTADSVRAR